MFRKYEKTFRILLPEIDVKGKHFHSAADTQRLLNGNVTVTEKVDGANVGIIRTKERFRLQKRGSLVDMGEHVQFNFFKAWSEVNQDKLIEIPKDCILYGELMYAKHHVFYNQLPDYFLPFGMCENDVYWPHEALLEWCNMVGLHPVPFIYHGPVTKDDLFKMIPDVSAYGDEPAEGIVLFNHKKQMRGKVVREEFVKELNEGDHWITKSVTKNLLTG